MNELQPVVDIVRQRLANGEQLDQINSELIEKGYTSDQIEWIRNEVSGTRGSKVNFKKYLPYIAIIPLLFFVASFFDAGTNLNATQISPEDYKTALSGDVVFNENFSTEDYPEVAQQISAFRNQIHFDGKKSRFFLAWSPNSDDKVLYDSETGKTKKLSGPWFRDARCTFLHLDAGCRYGDSWFVTDNGHVFVYINTDLGNVYKNDKANGLYFFDGNGWSKVVDSVTGTPPDYSHSIVFNNPSLFLTNSGCSLFFTRMSQHYYVDVCGQSQVSQTDADRQKITIDGKEASVFLTNALTQEIGETEMDPFAVAFSLTAFPISCDEIPQDELRNIKIDMGDGVTLPVSCGYGSISHSYEKSGTYSIKLIHKNNVLFEKVSNISTFVEDVTFNIEVKENDGRFNRGAYYVEITYATNPVCNLNQNPRDQGRAKIGFRKKHKDGHRYANDYGSLGVIKHGACSGEIDFPLTTESWEKDGTKTVRLEYVIDDVARATKDIIYPVKTTSDSDVVVKDVGPDNLSSSNKLVSFPYTISNIQTSDSIKISEIDYLEVTWDYADAGISNLVDPMLLFALTDEDGEIKKIGINRYDLGNDPRMKGVAVTAGSVQLVPPTLCHEYSASDCREQSYGLDKKYRISVYGGECLNPESNPSYCNGSQKHQFNRHLGDSNWIVIEQ